MTRVLVAVFFCIAALFDFERIIPMPTICREAEASSVAEEGAQLIIYRGEAKRSFLGDNVAIPAVRWERMKLETEEVHAGEVARKWLDLHPEYEEAGRKRLECILSTGYSDWYEWALANWGTKWGAYSVEERSYEPTRFTFKFETAWSFPDPIFEVLVKRFPTLTFDLATFDEGWNFAGEGQLGETVTTPFTVTKQAATDELYEKVYGTAPEKEDEDA